MARPAKMVDCPKCNGTGYLSCYAGIANGVCFRCAGNKVVRASTVRPAPKMTPYQEQLTARLVNTPAEEFFGMSFGELMNLRDFAHWPHPTVKNILNIWREKGEPAFQAAQEAKLEAFYASR